VAEYAAIDQQPVRKRLATTAPIFLAVAGLLAWSNADPGGFKMLWNYFAWANQVLAVFALMIAAVWLSRMGRPPWIALLPGAFMLFIVLAYILWVSPSNLKGAPWGLGLPYGTALAAAGAVTLAVSVRVWRLGRRREAARISP